jgi:tetratricopeptide (TPR) repeat protein
LRNFLLSFLLLLMPLLANANGAGDACPFELEGESLDSLKNDSRCTDDDRFLTALGLSYLQINMPHEAVTSLEKALLINPANGEARVIYAEALLAAGYVSAALNANKQILVSKDLPPAIHALTRLRDSLWRGERSILKQSVQYDKVWTDNINGGLSESSLTLDLQGGSITLDLSPASIKQAGFYDHMVYRAVSSSLTSQKRYIFTVDALGSNGIANSKLDLSLSLQKPAEFSSRGLLQITGTYRGLGLAESELEVAGRYSEPVSYNGASLNRSLFAKLLEFQGYKGHTAIQVGSELETASKELIFGRYTLGGWAAIDKVLTGLRDGGDKFLVGTYAGWGVDKNDVGYNLGLNLMYRKDFDAYSQVISPGVKREEVKALVSGAVLFGLGAFGDFSIGFESLVQSSNLQIFDRTSNTLKIAYLYSW